MLSAGIFTDPVVGSAIQPGPVGRSDWLVFVDFRPTA
jgi:hypothetical protein